MKTRFIVSEVFSEEKELEESEYLYDRNYKKDGFVLDIGNQICYKLIDREINLSIDDKIFFYGIRVITDKYYDVMEDVMEYETQEM